MLQIWAKNVPLIIYEQKMYHIWTLFIPIYDHDDIGTENGTKMVSIWSVIRAL